MRSLVFIISIMMASSANSQSNYLAVNEDFANLSFVLYAKSSVKWEHSSTQQGDTITVTDINEPILSKFPNMLIQKYLFRESFVTQFDANSTTIKCHCRLKVSQKIDGFIQLDISPLDQSAEQINSLDRSENSASMTQWWDYRNNSTEYSERNTIQLPKSRLTNYITQNQATVRNTAEPTVSIAIGNSQPQSLIQNSISIGVSIDNEPNAQTEIECPIEHLFVQETSPNQQEQTANAWKVYDIANNAGEPENEKILRKIRLFMELGFNLEANQLFQALSHQTPSIDILQHINNIIGDLESNTSSLDSLYPCSTSIALWSFLSRETRPLNSSEIKLVILQYKALKRPLQEVLRHRMLDLLTSENSLDELEMFVNVIGIGDVALQSHGDRPISVDDVVLANRNYPGKILNILEISSDRDVPELISLAESIRQEHQGTPMWEHIISSEISAHTNLRQYKSAYEKIELLIRSGASSKLTDKLHSQLAEDLILRGTQSHVLSIYMSDTFRLLPDKARKIIEDKAIQIGFPPLTNEPDEVNNLSLPHGFMNGIDRPRVNTTRTTTDLNTVTVQGVLAGAGEFREITVQATQ